jgi:alkylation response protein AidB-like acyl-CoA dehydrogenase
MDLNWSKSDQARFQEAENFAATRLANRTGVTGHDAAAWLECVRFGVFEPMLPADLGGQGRGALFQSTFFEHLGRGGCDRSLLFAMGAHLFGCLASTIRFGSEGQRRTWGRRLASEELVAALAMSEPTGGSAIGEMETRAFWGGDGYELRGRKTFVSNAPQAGLFLVIAREKEAAGPFSLTALLVPADTPGLSVTSISPTLGLSGAPMGEVVFDRCKLPADAVLGRQGGGLLVSMSCMLWERTCILAGFVGAAERDLRHCRDYLKARRSAEGSLFDKQGVRHRLARMKVRLETARWLIYRAAWNIDQGRFSLGPASMAKLVASESLVANAQDAMQLLAGAGWRDEAGIATALRDTIGTLSASGTSDIQLDTIAGTL